MLLFVVICWKLRARNDFDDDARVLIAEWRRIALWLGAMFGLSGLVYGLLFSDHRIWYCAQPGLGFFIVFFGGATLAWRSRGFSRRATLSCGATVVGAAMLLCANFAREVPEIYPFQAGTWRSLAQLDETLPPQARIGCFNAGVPAYFGTHAIINLDGLMNNRVTPYWQAHRFDRYLQDARIDYIIDQEGSLGRAAAFSSAPLPLVPLRSVGLTRSGSPRRVLWRVKRGL